jgi:hypothetical protein
VARIVAPIGAVLRVVTSREHAHAASQRVRSRAFTNA